MFFCRLYSWSVYVKNEENRHRTLILSIQVRSFFNEFFCTLFFFTYQINFLYLSFSPPKCDLPPSFKSCLVLELIHSPLLRTIKGLMV